LPFNAIDAPIGIEYLRDYTFKQVIRQIYGIHISLITQNICEKKTGDNMHLNEKPKQAAD
jgi:hypothetical protein